LSKKPSNEPLFVVILDIIRNRNHEHQENIESNKRQIRGQEREDMAIDMLSKTNGKASAYQEHLNAIIKKTNNFVPTIEALSKISNEYKNYEMVSTC
jgi:hypothetical protein